MPPALAAFAIAGATAALATPFAIRAALRTGFLDNPVGYKQHARPTPYLGGVAVISAFVVATILFGRGFHDWQALIACSLALLLIGSVDDRVSLGPGIRVAAVAVVASVLYRSGLGWRVFDGDTANFIFTLAFVLGVVNATNLMDNLDGAATVVVGTGAISLAALAAIEGEGALATVALAVAGACAGFLPFNLARPGRIFLGDGGSMPLGLLTATMIMNLPRPAGLDGEMLVVAVVLVGLPALDTALVIVSRLRRRVTVLSGGRDHLTHRLLGRLGSTRRVALALAAGQTILGVIAIGLFQLTPGVALGAAVACVAGGLAVIVALEAPRRERVRGFERAGA